MRFFLMARSWTAALAGFGTIVVAALGLACRADTPSERSNEAQATSPGTASPTTTSSGFRATGNEPGWRLDIADDELTLLTDMGKTRTVMPAPTPTVEGGVRTYAARDGGRSVTVTIADTLCVDTMSGMPHPNTVAVVLDGTTLKGCGGDPATLLHGEWLVETIAGAPVVKDSKPTIAFDDERRVSGHGSCNRFMGGFTLTGEGLTITQPAATMMACSPELMAQEGTFFKLLESVTSFSIADNVLTLTAADGRTIKARRAQNV